MKYGKKKERGSEKKQWNKERKRKGVDKESFELKKKGRRWSGVNEKKIIHAKIN